MSNRYLNQLDTLRAQQKRAKIEMQKLADRERSLKEELTYVQELHDQWEAREQELGEQYEALVREVEGDGY